MCVDEVVAFSKGLIKESYNAIKNKGSTMPKQGLGNVPEIKIKKENVGKFTNYCKRKGYNGVTQKCINEGKKSKDAGVRKMAVFAENARKWN